MSEPRSIRAGLGEALAVEIGKLDLLIARLWLAMVAVGFAAAAVFALTTSPRLGAWGMGLCAAYLVWFGFEARWRRLGRSGRRLDWASTLVESSVPWVALELLVETRGAAYALGSWLPPLLFAALVFAATARLRPWAPALLGASSALAFATLYFVHVAALLPPEVASWPLYQPAMQLTRAGSMAMGGVLSMLVARALRGAIGRADVTAREKELFGKYRLLDPIASGGMGTVYHAVYCPEGGFERPVAIKRIHRHLATQSEFVDAFRHEAELSARLVHPNIVQVLDFGRIDDTYFLAMEYVEGLTLASLARRARKLDVPLPPALVAYIGHELLSGLHHAHQVARGADGGVLCVVHRDLCPANVLLSKNGEVKISDFGVARALKGAAAAHTKTVAGHLGYMAPEQARAHPIDPRCDLFAVGVILWELLTGSWLFRRDGEGPTLLALMACEVARPSTLRAGVSEAWDELLLGAVKREPDGRYGNAQEMLAVLANLDDAKSARGDELASFIERMLSSELPPDDEVPTRRDASDELPTRVVIGTRDAV